MELNPPFVDLVVDFETVAATDAIYYDNLFKRIPLIGGWRTLTVIGGSFPQDLNGFSVGEYLLPRIEWDLWKDCERKNPSRKLTFGDYATLHPFLLSPFAGMNASASIRYTTDEHWLVMRGQGIRAEGSAGFAQFPAKMLDHLWIARNFVEKISVTLTSIFLKDPYTRIRREILQHGSPWELTTI